MRRAHEDWYGYDGRWYHQEGTCELRTDHPQVARSAGYDSDDKGLDWRAMNVIVHNAGARDTFGGYTTDETPGVVPLTQRSASCLYTQLDTARRDGDLGWAHTSDYVRVCEEPSLEEDEAENGYQKDTQENNVTKASSANGALHVWNLNIL